MQDQRDRTETDAPAQPAADRDRLIESIYRIALEPQTFDSFLGEWDAYISAQLTELTSLRETDLGQALRAANPDIEAHFSIAEQLLDQIGRPHTSPQNADESLARSGFHMMIDTEGRIVWSAGIAASRFGLKPNALASDLELPEAQHDALDRKIARLSQVIKGPSEPLLLQIKDAKTQRWHHMVAQIMPDTTSENVILVSPIAPSWPDGMPKLLRDGFALSPTEIAVSECTANGKTPSEIAEARGNSVATIRTQVKSVMAKMRCNTQGELVRLLHSIMRVAERTKTTQSRSWSDAERVTMLNLKDRDMPVEHFGDPDGYPVIFFHGLMDGNSATKTMRALLHKHRINLICPVRPWFGAAEGRVVGDPCSAPELFAQDIVQMIKQMGLRKPILFGHMGGALYAHAAAAALPDEAIKGMLIVSGTVPFVHPRKQFGRMSRRHRLVSFTARYTPSMMPFVIRAGISQIENGGERQFLNTLYETAPEDMALVADPETRDLILSGYRFTAQQGQKAFEVDSLVVTKDWSRLVDGSNIPVRLLHGAEDKVVDILSVQEFVAPRANRISLRILENTGQLVRYKNPDAVIEEICTIRDAP